LILDARLISSLMIVRPPAPGPSPARKELEHSALRRRSRPGSPDTGDGAHDHDHSTISSPFVVLWGDLMPRGHGLVVVLVHLLYLRTPY